MSTRSRASSRKGKKDKVSRGTPRTLPSLKRTSCPTLNRLRLTLWLAENWVAVWSAGSAPAEQINQVAVEAMREVGIDITGNVPTLLEYDTAYASDVIVTMGCGDACPVFPGKRYEDWKLDDPAGQGIEAVRPIRDEIERRVRTLLAQIDVPARH